MLRAEALLRAFAVALLFSIPAVASAAPRQLNCRLTRVESDAAPNFSQTENRSISVLMDQEAKTLAVSQGDSGQASGQALDHVTFSQLTVNGYTADMSLGLDSSSGTLVLQSYGPNSNKIEFGVCRSNPPQ